MKLIYRLIFCLAINLCLLYLSLSYFTSYSAIPVPSPVSSVSLFRDSYEIPQKSVAPSKKWVDIWLAAVCCGNDRVHETLTMIKSAIVFTGRQPKTRLNVIILTEPPLIPQFNDKLTEWEEALNGSLTHSVRPVAFPEAQWRKLFKPCASQRLFFPSLLKDVDAVLYVDTDVLFLSPLVDIWDHLSHMDSKQLAALTPEHEDPNTGWYNRFANHPYYGRLGVNSGVMLMNLTRMRNFHWESYLEPILEQYRLRITWGDQDIINIIFHYHPERLYIYDCRYNYRPDHCMYTPVCSKALKTGIKVLHGSRGALHTERHPAFAAIYQHFAQFQIGGDDYDDLLVPLEGALQNTRNSSCGQNYEAFTKEMRTYLESS